MREEIGHRVHARIGDLRGVQPRDELGAGEAARDARRSPRRARRDASRAADWSRNVRQPPARVARARPRRAAPTRARSESRGRRRRRPASSRVHTARSTRDAVRCAAAPNRRRRCTPRARPSTRRARRRARRRRRRRVRSSARASSAVRMPGERVHAGGDIGDRNADLGWRILAARERQQSDLALDQQIVRLAVGVRARRPVTRDGADDELRIPQHAARLERCRVDRRRPARRSARTRQRAQAARRARRRAPGFFRSSVSDSFDRLSHTK